MNKLNTVLIDDEEDSLALLRLQLERHCPDIGSITSYSTPTEAIQGLQRKQPHVVFIDVEMPVMNGFELLEQLKPVNFSVIFVTAFNEYAIRAFRFNALDYLLKPADADGLKAAVDRAIKATWPTVAQLTEANDHLRGCPLARIAVPSLKGISFVSLSDIMFVEASNNYSRIIQTDGSSCLLSKTLKDVQELLEQSHFLRIHRQYIVNLNHVKHFNRNEGILTMDGNTQLPIVRNRYDHFMDKYYRF